VAHILPNSKNSLKKILIANKIDFNQYRVVAKEQGEALALQLNLAYFETSAKKASNIDNTFENFVREILKSQTVKPIISKTSPIKETKTGKLTTFLS
jgi:putative ribosome biogenesis GTPase RsgA